jgi:glycerol-1-phosphate dehydrogenase [NAD(P)+]
MVNHVKTTYDSHGPVAVIGDTDILAQAPMNMITAGLGDTLGKYTCLLDWKLANLINGEYYCEDVVEMVHVALQTVMEQSDKIEKRDPGAVKAVTEALVLTGMAMSFIGNSRPASGCEHHLSHYWEMKFLMDGKKPILHGTKVGVGMIVALKLYHMLAEEAIDFASAKAKTFDKEAWLAKIKACYAQAAPGIIQLEEKCHKNDIEERNRRLEVMEANWPKIQELIQTLLPQTEEMEKLLQSLDAPINPEQIGVTMELVENGIQIAKEVRDRYTLLQMLWDLDLAEEYAKRAVTYFTKEQ